jgi:hypothetical protein
MSTTANEGSPSSGPSTLRSSLFSRQFSNASLLTIGSINTILPQYSAVGDEARSQNPPGFDGDAETEDQYYASPPPSESLGGFACSHPPPGSSIMPSRLSVVNPRHSTLLAWATNSNASADGSTRADFQYSFPIPSNKHWATLHLSTRNTIAGNPRASHTQPKLPRFWGCDPVTGVVQLDLDNPMTIQQINVTVPVPAIITSSFTDCILVHITVERQTSDFI